MGSMNPEQALRDYLSAPSVTINARPAPGTVGWQAAEFTGGLDAKPETIRVIKMRATPQRRVYAVSFETQAGRRMRSTCSVRQDDAGQWHFVAASGADGSPPRPQPWVNLGGGGWPRQFFAGGDVLANGLDVARVRLKAANGTEMEDAVEEGVVVFATDDEVRMPVDAELVDRSGNVVGRHRAMG